MQASSSGLVGEDAAYFDPAQQSAPKWAFFTAELAAVLGIMYVVRAQLSLRPCWSYAHHLFPVQCQHPGHACMHVGALHPFCRIMRRALHACRMHSCLPVLHCRCGSRRGQG